MSSFLNNIVIFIFSLSLMLGATTSFGQMEPPTGDGHVVMDCGSTNYTVTASPGAGGTDVNWYSDYLCTTLIGTGTIYNGITTESIVIYAATTDGATISPDPIQVYVFKPEFPSGSIDALDDVVCSSVDLILDVDVYNDSLEIFASEDATIDPTAPGVNFNNELLNIRADGYCGGDVKFLQKWDLTTIPASVNPSLSAMRATAYTGFAHGGDGSVKTKLVDDDSWLETTVTHATAPAESADNYGKWWIWYGWPSFATAHAGSADLVSIGASPEGNKTSTNNNILLNDIVFAEYLSDQTLSTYHWSIGYDTKYYSKDYKTDENLLITLKNVFEYNDEASCTYSWTGPDGFASTDKDIIGVTVTGTYTVTITSAYGCETEISQFVDVPLGDSIVIDGVISNTCVGSLHGAVDVTVSGGTPAFSFLWDSGEVTEDISGLGAGTYTLTVTDDNGCTGANSFTIDEFVGPVVDLGPDITYCSTETVTLDAENPGSTYLWQDGSTDQTYMTSTTGTYDVLVTDANGCFSTDEITLSFENLIADFTVSSNTGCVPFTTEFTNTSVVGAGVLDYLWEFGDGSTSDIYGPVGHTYESEGCFDVSLTVTSASCTSTQTYDDLVCTYAMPIANFSYSPNPIYADDPNVFYINLSDNATSYFWTFGDGTSSEVENPDHSYPDQIPSSYLTILYAYNDFGCVDSTFEIIEVKDIQIFYVPNAFTPDGSGYNDKFEVQFTPGLDVYDYHMTIYNRWGEPVWETYNVVAGWDGAYGGQGIVAEGIYVWKMEFGDSYSDERYEYTGHVTILK